MGASVLPSPEVSLAMGTGWRAGRTGRLPPREEIARPDDGVPSARPDDGVASGLELSPLPSSARYRVLPAIELSPLPSSAKLLVRARIPTISQSSAGGGWLFRGARDGCWLFRGARQGCWSQVVQRLLPEGLLESGGGAEHGDQLLEALL